MIVAELAILIPTVLAATLFLSDTGLAIYYRSKLDCVLQQVGQIIVQVPDPGRRSDVANSIFGKILKATGLSATDLKIAVKDIEIDGYQALKISGSASFKLIKGMDFLPTSLTLSDSTISVIPANRTEALIALSPYPYSLDPTQVQKSVYLPIVAPRPDLPIWQFPYDEALNRVHLLQGGVPDQRTNAANLPGIPPSLY
jgi:hypothetical protein